MDDRLQDALGRLTGSFTNRRATTGAILCGLIPGFGIVAWDETAAKRRKKKKKKCKAPNTKCGKTGCCKPGQACRNGACEGLCTFAMTATTWTLQQDCVLVSPIDIPDGVTLDGDGHTIVMQGTPGSIRYGFGADGVTASVRNLTLDGSGVTSTSCGDPGVGIQFRNASGAIESSTITGFLPSCGVAIRVIVLGGATPPQSVAIDLVSIADSHAGIIASAINPLTFDVTNCDMQNVNFGIQVQNSVDATIDSNEINANTYGVVVLVSSSLDASPDVTATNNTVTGAQIGMSVTAEAPSMGAPTLDASGSTIVGQGSIDATTHGLQYLRRAAGSADDNEISNFVDSRGSNGCGIFVAADAGAVTIGINNSFPPPPNEEDICDNSP